VTGTKESKGLSSYYIYLVYACLLSPELKERATELENAIRSIQDKNRIMKDKNLIMKDENDSVRDTIHSMQMEKLNLYIGNILVDFIKKIYQIRRLGRGYQESIQLSGAYATRQTS
jgi:hypothetical protein